MGIGGFLDNQTRNVGIGSKGVDPWAAARTASTGGIAGAYSNYTQGDRDAQGRAQSDYANNIGAQNDFNQGIANQLGSAGRDYYNSTQAGQQDYQKARAGVDTQFNNYNNQYKQRSTDLMNQASDQAKNASTTYSNNIKPALMNIMEDAQTQAGQAMSLKDAGDMNNSVQQGVRKFYNDEASGENAQGLANVGVMSALGAQALKGQIGSSMPLTGGQLSALQGQNMSQAGQAYAQTQQRIQSLRDQGIAQGLNQSNLQYNRGQQAREWAQNSANNVQNADQGFLQSQEQARNGINGLSSQINGIDMAGVTRQYGNAAEDYGMGQNLGGIGYQNAVNTGNMQMGIGNQYYNQQAGIAQGNLGAANAQLQSKNQMISGLAGTGGTIAGGMFGGPMGAMAGQQAGGAIGSGIGAGSSYPMYGQNGGGQPMNSGGGYQQASINPMMFQKNANGQFVNWQPQ